MKTADTMKLHKVLREAFLEPGHLAACGLEKGFAVDYIQSETFLLIMRDLWEEEESICSRTYELFRPMLESMQWDAPEAGWLSYFYYYALDKSFPDAVPVELNPEYECVCLFFMDILREVLNQQKKKHDADWQNRNTFAFLNQNEEAQLENPTEYRKFVKAFEKEYIYEMMKLSEEVTGHKTLDHITGVHYVALHIGRQLKNAGIPIDLGRVSGGAAGHDIGKYGCKESEYNRVPYLHYYYTDYWFKRHDIPYIGHIAVNHSTWDLELENLPLESLILIYADFRVKSIKGTDGRKVMHIYTLAEAFDIILGKLDNVDEKKNRRYRRVYMKLADFEAYMAYLGIETDLNTEKKKKLRLTATKCYYAMLQGDAIIEQMKFSSIDHNIRLMYRLRNEHAMNEILEEARNEKDWKNLREYIRIFEEYSTYLTQRQKLIVLKFLFDQLIHPEEDIRRHCAEMIGSLIAIFDEDYRKEVPKDEVIQKPEVTGCELLDQYMKSFLYPDHKVIPSHKQWIGYSTGIMISGLFSRCRASQVNEFRRIVLSYLELSEHHTDEIDTYLLQTAKHIPLSDGDSGLQVLYDYLMHLLKSRNDIARISALEMIDTLLPKLKGGIGITGELGIYLKESQGKAAAPVEEYLVKKILRGMGVDAGSVMELEQLYKVSNKELSNVFLKNLKAETHWVIKKAQIDMLTMNALSNPESNGFYTALHFCNLLKVSAVEGVRNSAGAALVTIIPHLTVEQRNDVSVELLRALELDGYQFSSYIPYYLGQILVYLPPVELEEMVKDLVEKVKHSNPQLNMLVLKTIGIFVVTRIQEAYEKEQGGLAIEKTAVRLLQVIINALADYNLQIKQFAFSVIGKEIFGSKRLTLEQKADAFRLIAKKVLYLISDNKERELQFLSNSAAFNHIYRFISEYVFTYGALDIAIPEKVAFFPGTFDPFSLSHKQIAVAIRDKGFEVYLAVDEFSWQRQALPNLIRRNIINMTIADELGIYAYPEDFSVNIANTADLSAVKGNFPNSELYLVAGSDVILNEEPYRRSKTKNALQRANHVVFDFRKEGEKQDQNAFEKALKRIEGKVIRLDLPHHYEDASPAQIRSYIDENREISSYIDPLAQKYIYENGLYQREPQYKALGGGVSIDVEVIRDFDQALLEELAAAFCKNPAAALRHMQEVSQRQFGRIILLRDAKGDGRIIGFSVFHWLKTSSVYDELKSSTLSKYIYDNAVGSMVLIDGIYCKPSPAFDNLEQVLLAETLAYCLAHDYDYIICRNGIEGQIEDSLQELLELCGFKKISGGPAHAPVYTVYAGNPCTLYLDIRSVIKEPYRSNANVRQVISQTRKLLMKALVDLYPGHLVLPFDRRMLHESLIKKICRENGVPTQQLSDAGLGPYICVPFGNILHKSIVPNTVTKSLHTEKYFRPDMKGYHIGAFPHYLDMETQLKLIRSFDRPIILVDDLLSKGYRMKALDPLLKQEPMEVKKIIVGILSNRGKELMDIQNREVDCAYFIPRLRAWFNESLQYPFIGGDALWRGSYPQRNLLPSVNLILPYTSPNFLKGTSKDAVYRLSEVCLQNAMDLLKILEEEYQEVSQRSLTLASLGNVFATPRCPDQGKDMEYNLNLTPSHYLENDLELLKRIRYYETP